MKKAFVSILFLLIMFLSLVSGFQEKTNFILDVEEFSPLNKNFNSLQRIYNNTFVYTDLLKTYPYGSLYIGKLYIGGSNITSNVSISDFWNPIDSAKKQIRFNGQNLGSSTGQAVILILKLNNEYFLTNETRVSFYYNTSVITGGDVSGIDYIFKKDGFLNCELLINVRYESSFNVPQNQICSGVVKYTLVPNDFLANLTPEFNSYTFKNSSYKQDPNLFPTILLNSGLNKTYFFDTIMIFLKEDRSVNITSYYESFEILNVYNGSNEFPSLDLKLNKSFVCLSPDQDQVCVDLKYNSSDPENDSLVFGLDTDLKPETILRTEYLEEPKGIFISNPISMINSLNSDPNFINNYDNLSCSKVENVIQQQANTKCINVIQANTPNNTQRVNSIMFNTFSRKESGNYFGFTIPTQSRNLVNSFRLFLLSEFPNIYYNYSFYTDLSITPLSNYGFMYNNTANTYKIVRNGQYITDISRSYNFNGKQDLVFLGFENYINLEENNNTEYFKVFVKSNNGNKTYIYTSPIFNTSAYYLNSLLYSFRILTNSNLSVAFFNSFEVDSFQRTPNLNLNVLPDKICYSDLGEYTTRIYYSDSFHIPDYKQKDLYLSVYDNETNPLCFLEDGISISQFDFDNPEVLPDQSTIGNQILVLLRIFTILASQLGFLETLRFLVKIVVLFLIYKMYSKFADLGISATDIFRRIFILLFFLNFVLYLALLIDKTFFVIFSVIGILYFGYEINAVGQGSQAQDTDKAFLYSTAFFSIISFIYFGFLQLTFRARFGIPTFPEFVFNDFQSGLNTILGFFGYLFGLLFYSIPDIPQFINIIFITAKLISLVSLIIVIRNFIVPTAKA